MEKETYLFRNSYNDSLQLLKLSDDQVRLFEWLFNEDIINNNCFFLDKLIEDDIIEI